MMIEATWKLPGVSRANKCPVCHGPARRGEHEVELDHTLITVTDTWECMACYTAWFQIVIYKVGDVMHNYAELLT